MATLPRALGGGRALGGIGGTTALDFGSKQIAAALFFGSNLTLGFATGWALGVGGGSKRFCISFGFGLGLLERFPPLDLGLPDLGLLDRHCSSLRLKYSW